MNDPHFIVYTGAVSRGNPGQAGAGAVILQSPRNVHARLYRSVGIRTNNEAEYEAVIMALKRALRNGLRCVVIRSSSELIINQLTGAYAVKSAALASLHREAVTLLSHFEHWQAEHVPRHRNHEPYRLANKALDLSDAADPPIATGAA